MSVQGKEVTLVRDCPATRIPSGESISLKSGERYHVSQALGGSVTLKDTGGLYRIGFEDIDAIGEEMASEIKDPDWVDPDDASFNEGRVWDALRQCFDPEIPINIVDLGLIYDLLIQPAGPDRFHVAVKMTLTATGCGMGPTIAADAKSKIESLEAVESADVEIVWDPQWSPRMISGEGRKILGLD